MTDVNHKMLVWLAYGMRMVCVWLLAGTFGLVNAAQAGAWEEFERRCLVPMENVKAPITDGLSSGTTPILDEFMAGSEANARTFVSEEGRLAMVVIDPSENDFLGCGILADSATVLEIDWAASETWLAEQISNRRYVEAGSSLLGPYYHSTVWREPKLRFSKLGGDDPIYVAFFLSETGLES